MAAAEAKKVEEQKRPKQGRSPAYPGIDLKEAIAKAKALYDAEGKYPAPMSSAFKAWGFSAKSSGGREIRAALGYFGLTTVQGDRETGTVQLTEKALRVLLDEREDQSEKKALVREFALTPGIHKKLLAKFPEGIKSDATAAHYLVFDEGYNKQAAAELVSEFKLTAAYAGLFQPDNIVDKSAEEAPVDGEDDQPPPPPPGQKGSQVKVMAGERIVFTEENNPQQYLKLVASGDVDDSLLEALEDYVKRQRKRLKKEDGPAN